MEQKIWVRHKKKGGRFFIKERCSDLLGETYFIIKNEKSEYIARPDELALLKYS